VLKHERVRRALSCIRCGACLNACPVYKNIGGYTYNSVYTGPIGAVITPHMENMRDYKHLSFASSLCGSCTEVCPVHIPLHELLLVNRKESVEEGLNSGGERFVMRNMKKVLLSRKRMNMGGGFKNFLFRNFFASSWGPRRELPKLEAKTFNKLWREKQEEAKEKEE